MSNGQRKRITAISMGICFAAIVVVIVLAVCGLFDAKQVVVLSPSEIELVVESNDELTFEQQALVDAATLIVGKVSYFWGGKSTAIGMDPDWGKPRVVESSGSDSSGTERPFGLDCSGYVSWCFRQLGYSPKEIYELIGEGTWNQWDKSTPIKWKELQVGDFVFQNAYPAASANHIGICIGFLQNGTPVFAHCSFTENNVTVTTAGDVFRYARRPSVFVD